jgi:hypothetical protein
MTLAAMRSRLAPATGSGLDCAWFGGELTGGY